ncbi:MAG: DUF433 domain-containing protein [Gemmatimonadota bacterium]|nr:DUF433 domain-containing protein [Gemmatimonadota bacterium]
MPDRLERITLNPEIRSGKPVIRGTRITVADELLQERTEETVPVRPPQL